MTTMGRSHADVHSGDARPGALERRYRRLLLAYPRDYRADHGDELIGTILDSAEPGRAVPSAREAAALIVGGLRARVTRTASGPAWADGLHLGATVLAVINLATLVRYAGSLPIWTALSALTLLAVLRGRFLAAIPLVAVTGIKTAGLALGRPWLGVTLLPVYPDTPLPGVAVWHDSALHSVGGPVAPVAGYVLLLAAVAVLAVRGGAPRRRSWWWTAAVPVLAATEPAWLQLTAATPRTVARVALEIAVFALAIWAGHVARDPRWTVPAGAYLLVALMILVENPTRLQQQDLSHWALLAFLTLTMAAAPVRARRHALL